jgi:hypothetical protein
VADPEPASADGPAQKRGSWSIKAIAEEIAGVPIGDLQDPDRPLHPYLKTKLAFQAADATARASSSMPPRVSRPARSPPEPEDAPVDPVDRVYPPLAGPTGRTLHGKDHEHHSETLERQVGPSEPSSPGRKGHAPGPSQRPERIYLHYLLLHIDRLNDSALRYLKQAVDEEMAHRQG